MKYISLDIETAPIEIKHPDVIRYLMDKKISKESRSMNPLYSKIITIGVKVLGEETKLFFGDNEKQILEDFWIFVKNQKQETGNLIFVTYNGYKFDIPFLNIRSAINYTEAPVKINTNRWNMQNSNHFDVMMFFSQFETFTNPNLRILAKMHDIEMGGEQISGADIEKLFQAKNWEKIKEKCRQDLELTEKIFEKFCKL